ncbi:uncharacterized protein LOC121368658 [Gigantopelta aegis]|uniref:uncharacterized protein LOC121368658 n=1 Tax=Gigantopelta aegis TaxID=1735272 RepID=UPI001B888E0C|nr:uncharacterized protein LOC121368658 [Gigantopelta aegis]
MTMLLIATLVLLEMVMGTDCQIDFQASPDDCTKYKINIRAFSVPYEVAMDCPRGLVFSLRRRRCVPKYSEDNDQCPIFKNRKDVFELCRRCPNRDCLYPDPMNCARYYNCSKPLPAPHDELWDNMEPYQQECEYPGYFDRTRLRCEKDFSKVKCATDQEQPIDFCEYKANVCLRAHCRPCIYSFPSCRGLSDGIQAWTGRTYTPYYTKCFRQRALTVNTCPPNSAGQPRIFSAKVKRCRELRMIPRKFGGLSEMEEEDESSDE